jgi:hypothetical protein
MAYKQVPPSHNTPSQRNNTSLAREDETILTSLRDELFKQDFINFLQNEKLQNSENFATETLETSREETLDVEINTPSNNPASPRASYRPTSIDPHINPGPLDCDICKKTGFCHRTNLLTHQLTHHENLHYTCKVCKRKFHKQASLNSHKQIHIEHPVKRAK